MSVLSISYLLNAGMILLMEENPKQPPGKSFGTNCLSTGAGFFPSPVFRMGIIRIGIPRK